MKQLLLAAIAAVSLIATAFSQTTPGPVWSQLPPIGRFTSQCNYVDASGALVAVGGYTAGRRVWRHAGTWSEIGSSPAAPNHGASAFAYEQTRDVLIQFGGWPMQGGSAPCDEHWEFDGATWQQRTPTNLPTPRARAAMAYDPVRDRTVLYGGRATLSPLHDTWEFDGANWTALLPATQPQIRSGCSMTFDANLQQLLLVGTPVNSTSNSCETWSFDGNDWTQIVTLQAPEVRQDFRMAHDPVQGATVLHGGTGFLWGPPNNETWLFDGTQWTVQVTNHPPAFLGVDLVYWPTVGGVVCVGGISTGTASGAIYRYGNASWLPITPELPFQRARPWLAFDSARQCIVLHGGLAQGLAHAHDTWEWTEATGWIQTDLGNGPLADIAYDPGTGCVIGISGGLTWRYCSGAWTAQALSGTPQSATVCYDRHRQRVVATAGTALWSFDGQQWHAEGPVSGPPPTGGANGRTAHSAADDAIITKDVLSNEMHALLDGVWTPITSPYGAVSLTDLTADPLRGGVLVIDANADATMALRRAAPIAYWHLYANRDREDIWHLTLVTDHRTGQILGVGAHGEVWRLDWHEIPALTPFGLGCAGSNGVPDLDSPSAFPMPQLGQPLTLSVANLPTSSGALVLALGDSIEQMQGMPLPVALDPIGLVSCRAWISWQTGLAYAHGGGSTTITPTLPATPALAGVTFGAQAIVLDPAASPGWGTVSNAVLVTAY